MTSDLSKKTALACVPQTKTKWRRTMEENLEAAGLTWDPAARTAQYRGNWRDVAQRGYVMERQDLAKESAICCSVFST